MRDKVDQNECLAKCTALADNNAVTVASDYQRVWKNHGQLSTCQVKIECSSRACTKCRLQTFAICITTPISQGSHTMGSSDVLLDTSIAVVAFQSLLEDYEARCNKTDSPCLLAQSLNRLAYTDFPARFASILLRICR